MTKEEIRRDGRMIGWIDHDTKIYFSYRNPEIHLMKKYNGYAVSVKVLNYLDTKNVTHIIILTEKRNYVYTLLDFMLSNLEHLNEDDDLQLFCSIDKAK